MYEIKPFRFWCQKVLPLVYDDSLSYMELLCKIVTYLNNVINDVNQIPEYIQSLLTDEKLKSLFDETLDELRAQLAVPNEGEKTTASADRSAGDILWLDGKLVQITRDILAGTEYIEETGEQGVTGNFVYITFESMIGNLYELATTEKGSLVEAINEVLSTLHTLIGDMNELDTETKTNIVSAINEVLSTANSLVGDLDNLNTTDKSDVVSAINSLIVSVNGLIGDLDNLDTTDKSSIVNAINEVIDLVEATNINTYINVLEPRNELEPLDNTGTTDNTAKLQAIINYYGANHTYYFPCGTYLINGTISVSVRHVSFMGEQRAGTTLKHTTDVNMFEISSVNFVYFEHLFFRNTYATPSTSAYFITVTNSPYCVINDVSMYNSCRYIKCDTSQGFKCYDLQLNNDEIYPTDTVIGLLLTGRNVSSRFIRVTMNFINNPTAYGIYCIDWAQDIYIQRFETTGCVNAVYLYNTTASNPGDIIIRDSIFDLVKGPAIRLRDLKTTNLHNTNIIASLYITPYETGINCIRLDNCDNITVDSVGINNPENISNVTGISINGGKNINVNHCQFANIYRALAVVSATSNVMVNDNIYDSYATTNGAGIVFTNVTRGNIISNIIAGNATTAISVDANCSDIIIALNNIESGTLSDNGTGTVKANNIVPS